MRYMAKILIKYKAKLSALLTSRLHAMCSISCRAQARQCFNCFYSSDANTAKDISYGCMWPLALMSMQGEKGEEKDEYDYMWDY